VASQRCLSASLAGAATLNASTLPNLKVKTAMTLTLMVAVNVLLGTLVVGGLALLMTYGTRAARQPVVLVENVSDRRLITLRNASPSATDRRSVSGVVRVSDRRASLSGSTR
jgi:hypothetical protein